MVLVCPTFGDCESYQWKTVKGHVKKCATAPPNLADRNAVPGELHWRKSDPLLQNHTRAAEMEAVYILPVWPDAPNDEEATDQGQIFQHIQKEWTAQVGSIRKAAAAEASRPNQSLNEQLVVPKRRRRTHLIKHSH